MKEFQQKLLKDVLFGVFCGLLLGISTKSLLEYRGIILSRGIMLSIQYGYALVVVGLIFIIVGKIAYDIHNSIEAIRQ